MKCSICGSEKYTKRGNTDALWLFECENGHRWTDTRYRIWDEFPYQDDDEYNPKYWAWDIYGRYRPLSDTNTTFARKAMTQKQWREYRARKLLRKNAND